MKKIRIGKRLVAVLMVWTLTLSPTLVRASDESYDAILDFSEENSIEDEPSIETEEMPGVDDFEEESSTIIVDDTIDEDGYLIDNAGMDDLDELISDEIIEFPVPYNEETEIYETEYSSEFLEVSGSAEEQVEEQDTNAIQLEKVPRDWVGEYDGQSVIDSVGKVVRRDFVIHFNNIYADGSANGTAEFSPSDSAPPELSYYGGYEFSANIDVKTGKIDFQGHTWTNKPIDNFSFIALSGMISSDYSSIIGTSEHGIWNMKASDTNQLQTTVTLANAKGKVLDDVTLYGSINSYVTPTSSTISWTVKKDGEVVEEYTSDPAVVVAAGENLYDMSKTFRFDQDGIYEITAAFIGVSGKCTAKIDKRIFQISLPESELIQIYTGEPLYPEPIVENLEGQRLTEGSDYTLTYSNNTEPGEAAITADGTGAYRGASASVQFNITDAEFFIRFYKGQDVPC